MVIVKPERSGGDCREGGTEDLAEIHQFWLDFSPEAFRY